MPGLPAKVASDLDVAFYPSFVSFVNPTHQQSMLPANAALQYRSERIDRSVRQRDKTILGKKVHF